MLLKIPYLIAGIVESFLLYFLPHLHCRFSDIFWSIRHLIRVKSDFSAFYFATLLCSWFYYSFSILTRLSIFIQFLLFLMEHLYKLFQFWNFLRCLQFRLKYFCLHRDSHWDDQLFCSIHLSIFVSFLGKYITDKSLDFKMFSIFFLSGKMKISTCIQLQEISAKCHCPFKILFISSSDSYSWKEKCYQLALLLLVD